MAAITHSLGVENGRDAPGQHASGRTVTAAGINQSAAEVRWPAPRSGLVSNSLLSLPPRSGTNDSHAGPARAEARVVGGPHIGQAKQLDGEVLSV